MNIINTYQGKEKPIRKIKFLNEFIKNRIYKHSHEMIYFYETLSLLFQLASRIITIA